jgi:hypothetical protein
VVRRPGLGAGEAAAAVRERRGTADKVGQAWDRLDGPAAVTTVRKRKREALPDSSVSRSGGSVRRTRRIGGNPAIVTRFIGARKDAMHVTSCRLPLGAKAPG